MRRTPILAAMLAALALSLSGCVSIKSETATQPRVPGVVTLGGTICVSDYDANTYADCQPANIAEPDGGCHGPGCFINGDGDDNSVAETGQLLLGFRVADGTGAPSSFQSLAQDTTFNRSDSYSQALTALIAAVPGEHWVGYVSGFKTIDPHNQAADREISFAPEFSLPAQAGGGPLTTPLHWRLVAGFRELQTADESSLPVNCSDSIPRITFCEDTPATAATDLANAVSDFGVLRGSAARAGQGATATVSFPVSYADGGGLGARTLALSATTTVPGGVPALPATLRAANGTTPVAVRVPIPAGTPLGSYTVTLTASEGTPAVQRSNTATLVVADPQAPSIRIGTPAQGATFARGQVVRADYDCADQLNASGVRTCAGPVAAGAPIDTATVGTKTFTVNAADAAGNASSATRTYTVSPSAAPFVSVGFTFSSRGTTTRFTTLAVKGAPRGSTVTATCHGPKCPVRKTLRARGSGRDVKLSAFLHKPFRAGDTIEVRVTSPGAIGAVRVVSIRRGKAPAVAVRCLPPGAKKPGRC